MDEGERKKGESSKIQKNVMDEGERKKRRVKQDTEEQQKEREAR